MCVYVYVYDLFKYYLEINRMYVKNTFLFLINALYIQLYHIIWKVRVYLQVVIDMSRPLWKAGVNFSTRLYSIISCCEAKLKVFMFETKDSDYQLTGSTSGTPLATQNTPDGLPPSSLPTQQTNNHLQGLPAYSHNDYNNYPTLPVSTALMDEIYWFRRLYISRRTLIP